MIIQQLRDERSLQFGQVSVRLNPSGFMINDYTIEMPGEYDVANIGVEAGEGYAVLHGEGLNVLAIEPTHPRLVPENIGELEDLHLLVVPAPADPERRKVMTNLVNNLEPRGVVVFGSADDAKALAGSAVEPQPKVKITATDLAGEERRVWSIA